MISAVFRMFSKGQAPTSRDYDNNQMGVFDIYAVGGKINSFG